MKKYKLSHPLSALLLGGLLSASLAASGCGSSGGTEIPDPNYPNGTGAMGNGSGGSNTGGNGAAGESQVEGGLAARYSEYFPVGVAIGQGHINTVSEIITTHFNHLTAENAWKWGSLTSSEGNYNWGEADAIAELGRQHQMKITGHALVWHRQTPSWLFADTPDAETLKARMKAHTDTIVARYADVVDNWDVVNEAISDDGSKTYRDGDEGSEFYATFGNEEYVYWAFKYAYDALEAQEAGSAAGKLYYNDYNVTLKIDKIITMLDAVRAQGGHVDGIGLQAHVNMDWPTVADIQSVIDKCTAAGYKVKISELDVSVYSDYPGGVFTPAPEVAWTEELATAQAERYRALFQLFRDNSDAITSVSVWGVSDDATWLDNEPVENRNNYPLLFDENREPKPALDAIMNF